MKCYYYISVWSPVGDKTLGKMYTSEPIAASPTNYILNTLNYVPIDIELIPSRYNGVQGYDILVPLRHDVFNTYIIEHI